MRNIAYLLLIIGALMIASCSIKNEPNVEKLPGIDIPVNKMNSKIGLEPNPGMPQEHKSGEILGYLIRNLSNDTIVFGQNYGVKIFQKAGTNWETVEDKMGYPEGEKFLPTSSVDPTGLGMFVMPDIKDIKSSTIVRIVVIGHVKDKPAEQVGAYIDVLYTP